MRKPLLYIYIVWINGIKISSIRLGWLSICPLWPVKKNRFWPVLMGRSKARVYIFPATTLPIPVLWPTGAGELSGSDPWVGPFWTELVLRTRAFHSRTDWSDRTGWINRKHQILGQIETLTNTCSISLLIRFTKRFGNGLVWTDIFCCIT